MLWYSLITCNTLHLVIYVKLQWKTPEAQSKVILQKKIKKKVNRNSRIYLFSCFENERRMKQELSLKIFGCCILCVAICSNSMRIVYNMNGFYKECTDSNCYFLFVLYSFRNKDENRSRSISFAMLILFLLSDLNGIT